MLQRAKSLWGFIWLFIKKQKFYFFVIQIMALAWSIDNTAWPYAFKLLIDKILAYSTSQGSIWHYLMPTLTLWASLWLLVEVMFRVQGFIMAYTFPRLEAAVRMAMFDYVAKHSFDFFANNFAGNISNKISDMTQSITRILQLLMTLFIPALVALIIATLVFLSIKPVFAILLFGWVILHMGICLASAKYCANKSNIHATSRSFLTGKIVDTFSNITNVHAFTRHRYEYDYINNYQSDEKNKNQSSLIIIEKVKILLGISSFIFPGVMMTWLVIHNWQKNTISVGDVVLIFNTSWNIMLFAWIAGMELPNLFKEIGICQQALSIIKTPHAVIDHKDAQNHKVTKGHIRINQLCFNYDNKNTVFNNLSLDIKAGTKLGLVGYSGSGKTTLVNLIMRFFDIKSGSITIDGMEVQQITLQSLRGQIAMIPQSPTLFHRSLRENIAYGNPRATEQQIIAAAKHAHCHDFITALPDGYNSLVGEQGIKLSGGQRQRIAIARAILKNAPILILDEATSALDSVTEHQIQQGLHYLMKGKTTIVIAHRLSTLHEMDNIVVFDKGHIIESGNHKQLLENNGQYATMWQMQAGGFLPDVPAN